jgi:hypothetical protein
LKQQQKIIMYLLSVNTLDVNGADYVTIFKFGGFVPYFIFTRFRMDGLHCIMPLSMDFSTA